MCFWLPGDITIACLLKITSNRENFNRQLLYLLSPELQECAGETKLEKDTMLLSSGKEGRLTGLASVPREGVVLWGGGGGLDTSSFGNDKTAALTHTLGARREESVEYETLSEDVVWDRRKRANE